MRRDCLMLKGNYGNARRFPAGAARAVIMIAALAMVHSCGPGSGGRAGSGGADPNAFLGEKPPGGDPVIFAPGIVSTEKIELNAAFTPDGREFYFTRRGAGRKLAIMAVRRSDGGGWNAPEVAPFSGVYSDADPFITADGRMMFFISKRPAEGYGPPNDIWMMDRAGDGWSEPRNPGFPLNTPVDIAFPSMSGDGLLYHAAEYYGGGGRRDIYALSFINGEVEGPPRLVGGDVSGEYDEADPLIARDGSWLVFVSAGRPGGFGAADLYFVFRNGDGSWSKARNLGGKVNTKAYEYSPAISPDGRYFFFTRDGDIYWVNSKILFDLRDGAL
jgi:Tol biopolymer transport system component